MKKKICTVDVGINGILQCSLVKIAFVLLLIISFLIRLHLAPVCVLSADYNDYINIWLKQGYSIRNIIFNVKFKHRRS